MESFEGRIAVVTGGGTGMGHELTRHLARAGCHVATCDVSADALAVTKERALAEAPNGTRVVTFVADDNIASLKGCKRAGFSPYLRREERWRWFRRTLTFTPLPEGTPYPFDESPSA